MLFMTSGLFGSVFQLEQKDGSGKSLGNLQLFSRESEPDSISALKGVMGDARVVSMVDALVQQLAEPALMGDMMPWELFADRRDELGER